MRDKVQDSSDKIDQKFDKVENNLQNSSDKLEQNAQDAVNKAA